MSTPFCTFRVGATLIGLPVSAVQEVIAQIPMTPVPSSPKQLRGLINLRGDIVTVLNLHHLLGQTPRDHAVRSYFVIAHVDNGVIGLLVDDVREVHLVDEAAQREPRPPTLGPDLHRHTSGLIRLQDELLLVLDLPTLSAPVAA